MPRGLNSLFFLLFIKSSHNFGTTLAFICSVLRLEYRDNINFKEEVILTTQTLVKILCVTKLSNL